MTQGLISNFIQEYNRTTLPKIKLLDKFIVFSSILGLIQLAYIILAGSHPYNAFLSGLICSIGFSVFTICLRLQLLYPKDFGNIKPESAFASYLVINLVLFFVVITFMG